MLSVRLQTGKPCQTTVFHYHPSEIEIFLTKCHIFTAKFWDKVLMLTMVADGNYCLFYNNVRKVSAEADIKTVILFAVADFCGHKTQFF